jgi:hypothetical protein
MPLQSFSPRLGLKIARRTGTGAGEGNRGGHRADRKAVCVIDAETLLLLHHHPRRWKPPKVIHHIRWFAGVPLIGLPEA